MTYRTVVISSYEDFLEFEYPGAPSNASNEDMADENEHRNIRLARFPYPVMLQLAFPELDFANRWCWSNFGPADGRCNQPYSEYPACTIGSAHCHKGQWMNHRFVKTDYDFGFSEWYFPDKSHRDHFYDHMPSFNWGELYPKTN